MAIVVLTILAHAVSLFTFDRIIEYKKITFRSPRIPKEMNGYKIAFISDTHAMPVGDLEKVKQELNKWHPDLLLLGGDFPAGDGAKRIMAKLSQVETTDGIYGVEGNHDNYVNLFAAMEQYSIHPLSNSGARVREHLYIAGVEDLWNRNPSIDEAIRDALPDDFVILVSHNPDITMLQDTTSVDLILSGHTHGGQITLFGLWAPALHFRPGVTKYGQRFMSGWATSRDGIPVYVSNGTGFFERIPRIFARPQVILLTLGVE